MVCGLVVWGIDDRLSRIGVGKAPKAETTGVRAGVMVSGVRCEASGVREGRCVGAGRAA